MTTTTKPESIDDYIKTAPKEVQQKLREMREVIRKAAPDAVESLKWSMPAFSYKRILVTFAYGKSHIGFYPTPSALKAFSKELKVYKTGPGSIQFPLVNPLPIPLIRKITEFRVKESVEDDKKWKE